MQKFNDEKMNILGLSFYYHDSAAALITDGIVQVAAQEERFTRKKHDESFPRHSIAFCLEKANIDINDLDYIVFYEKPVIKFERLLKTYITTWPRGIASFCTAMVSLFGKKFWVENKIRKETGFTGEILYTKHHHAHAASAYYCSPYDDAAVVTIDGVGEWDTTTISHGKGNDLKTVCSLEFPDSLGLLYSAVTYFLGFKVNSGEYKVMGLAPYGDASKYYDTFKTIIDIKDDGSYKLDQSFFSYQYAMKMISKKFERHFDLERRSPESELTQEYKDVAAALQKITEEIILKIVTHAKKVTNSKKLCMAGGVALNCVANGKILQKDIFDEMYVQPASGDAGNAVGAALYVYFDVLKNQNKNDVMSSVYLGETYAQKEINEEIKKTGLHYKEFTGSDLYNHVATLIDGENAIGWFQGAMEFGPRALGNRSIIADPRRKENWQKINLKIKYRESFRPFAPAVLSEHAETYFDLKEASPYMLLVAQVLGTGLPAITHVDGSARIQTVDKKDNETFHRLLSAFHEQTGCPVVINTSFNVRGEPIVMTPKDALRTFINTEMDHVVIGNAVVSRNKNEKQLKELRDADAYLSEFQLD